MPGAVSTVNDMMGVLGVLAAETPVTFRDQTDVGCLGCGRKPLTEFSEPGSVKAPAFQSMMRSEGVAETLPGLEGREDLLGWGLGRY